MNSNSVSPLKQGLPTPLYSLSGSAFDSPQCQTPLPLALAHGLGQNRAWLLAAFGEILIPEENKMMKLIVGQHKSG